MFAVRHAAPALPATPPATNDKLSKIRLVAIFYAHNTRSIVQSILLVKSIPRSNSPSPVNIPIAHFLEDKNVIAELYQLLTVNRLKIQIDKNADLNYKAESIFVF